jgi:hypothetical protein
VPADGPAGDRGAADDAAGAVGPGAGCRLVGDPERRAYTSSDDAAGLRTGPLGANELLKLRWPAVKAWHLPPARELPNPADIWLRRERRGPAALR